MKHPFNITDTQITVDEKKIYEDQIKFKEKIPKKTIQIEELQYKKNYRGFF